MTNFRIPVQPDTYFKQHAQGNRVSANNDDTSIRLNEQLHRWVNLARSEIDSSQRDRVQIISLAVEFGADRPLVEWGMPVGNFIDIVDKIRKQQVVSKVQPVVDLRGMETSHEPDVMGGPIKFHMSASTADKIDVYSSLLQTNQSVIIRHCMALSFRWFSEDVFVHDQYERDQDLFETYSQVFKRELESRIEYARDELGMNV